MEHDHETGCQVPPERSNLCTNNCGFFGSATTMNMCSKCHNDMLLKQWQVKFAAFIKSNSNVPVVAATTVGVQVNPVEPKTISSKGPNRCSTCRKRVGLTGFNCRCGNLFCALHRHSYKHDCTFDYRTAARVAIAKANPVVKAKKLNKI